MQKMKNKVEKDIDNDRVNNITRWARHILDTLTKEEVINLHTYIGELLDEK